MLGMSSCRFHGDSKKLRKVAKTHDFVTKCKYHMIVFLNFQLNIYAEFKNNLRFSMFNKISYLYFKQNYRRCLTFEGVYIKKKIFEITFI